MLNGAPPKGLTSFVERLTKDFGIWHQHWYNDIINSTGFTQTKNIIKQVPHEYENIYMKSLKIYEEINKYSIRL